MPEQEINQPETERFSLTDLSTRIEQPKHKLKQKVGSPRIAQQYQVECELVEDEYINRETLRVILDDYLNGSYQLKNGKRKLVEGLVDELGLPIVYQAGGATAATELNGSVEPSLKTQPKKQVKQPRIVKPKLAEPNPTVTEREDPVVVEKPTSYNPVAWLMYATYSALAPIEVFLRTSKASLLLAFGLISVQAYQVALAYLEYAGRPEIREIGYGDTTHMIMAVLFAVLFESTGLNLTIQTANKNYLLGFAILAATINVCHHRAFEFTDGYELVLKLVFSVGLPFAIFSFSEKYSKTKFIATNTNNQQAK